MKTSDREKQEFRNVALHLDTHSQIKEIADAEQRTITRQLKIIIEIFVVNFCFNSCFCR